MVKNITIKSHYRNYSVIFTDNFKKEIENISKDSPVHFLVDETIWKLYKKKHFSHINAVSFYIVSPKESNKSIDKLVLYIKFLLDKKFQKHHKLIVIGGGLAQDIGSFTAH